MSKYYKKGDRIGNLVIENDPEIHGLKKNIKYTCRCDCGNMFYTTPILLNNRKYFRCASCTSRKIKHKRNKEAYAEKLKDFRGTVERSEEYKCELTDVIVDIVEKFKKGR